MAFSLGIAAVVVMLLYGWTLTETVTLRIFVESGSCTAVLAERQSTIPCPGLEGGAIGVYIAQPSTWDVIVNQPLDLFTPPAGWQSIAVRGNDGSLRTPALPGHSLPLQRAGLTIDSSYWQAPNSGAFEFSARIRRPDGALVGVIFRPDGRDEGWAFEIDSSNRQGVWKSWQNGRPGGAIAGAPFQKPLQAQAQSLLRQIMASLLGALLLAAAAAGLALLRRKSQPGERVSSKRSASRSANRLLLPAILLTGVFGLTLWIALDLLQGIPHVQDSITFLFQAQTLSEGGLWAPEPPLAEAFRQEFLTTWQGKWFGQYPPGYAALLAVGVRLGAPWLLNPLLAVLTIALIYKLGTLFYGRSIGLLAAALVLLSPFFLILSGSLMVHAAELFWAALTMVCWTLALRRPDKGRWALAAGGALGATLLTRQVTAVIVGGTFVALLPLVQARPWRGLGRQTALLLTGTLPFVFMLLGYQAALTGSATQDPRLLGRPFDRPGFGDDIGERQNAFRLAAFEDGTAVTWYTDPDQPPRGHSLPRGLFNTQRNWDALTRTLFGWYPLFGLALCWLPFIVGRPYRADWLWAALIGAVLAIYVTYWSAGIMYGPRYYYVALPALLLLSARGVATLAARFGRTVTGVVLLALFGTALLFYWPGTIAELRGYNFISADELRMVEVEIDGQGLVFVPTREWWDYGRFFSANRPKLDGRLVFARDLGPARNACLQQALDGRPAYLWQPDLGLTKALTDLPVCPGANGES